MSKVFNSISRYIGWYFYKPFLLAKDKEIEQLQARNSYLEYYKKYTAKEEIEHLYSVLAKRK